MNDELATLKAAEAAGATIQGYTVECDDGSAPLHLVEGRGYWRDLEGPVQWSCDPSRYRRKPEDVA